MLEMFQRSASHQRTGCDLLQEPLELQIARGELQYRFIRLQRLLRDDFLELFALRGPLAYLFCQDLGPISLKFVMCPRRGLRQHTTRKVSLFQRLRGDTCTCRIHCVVCL